MSGNVVYELEVPAVPPSLNVVGGTSHWTRYRDEKQSWELVLVGKLERQRIADVDTWARCSAHLRFPTARRRDEGNFRFLLEKALGDALVRQRWIVDDDAGHYRFERLHFDPVLGPERTLVVVELCPTS